MLQRALALLCVGGVAVPVLGIAAGTCGQSVTDLTAASPQVRLLQAACANDAQCAAAMQCGGGLELTPAQLSIAPRAVAVAQSSSRGAVCKSRGAGHIKSLIKHESGNGRKYRFQMKGVYWLLHSPEIKVQVRQCPWGSGSVKGNTAVAIQYMGGEIITIRGADTRADEPTVTVRVGTNGPETALTGNDLARGVTGAGSRSVKFEMGGYTVSVHRNNGIFLDVVVAVPAGGVPWIEPENAKSEIDLAVMSGLCVSFDAAKHADRILGASEDILVDARTYGGQQCGQDTWPPTPPPAVQPPNPIDPTDGKAVRTKAVPACARVGDDADDCVVDVLFAVAADPAVNWRKEIVEPAVKAKLIEDVLVSKVKPATPSAVAAGATQTPPPPPGGACASSGDPHFTSFTGDRFDFQMRGIHWLLYSSDLKVQVRQCPWSLPSSLNAGVQGNTAVAIKYRDGPIITVLGGDNELTESGLPAVCVTPAGTTPDASCTGGQVGDSEQYGISGHDTGHITFEKDGYRVSIGSSRIFLNVNVAVPQNGIEWADPPPCEVSANSKCPKGCQHTPFRASQTCTADLVDPVTGACPDGCARGVILEAGAPPDADGSCGEGFSLNGGACERNVPTCTGQTRQITEVCEGTAVPFQVIDTSEGQGTLGLCVHRAAARLANDRHQLASADQILFDDRTYAGLQCPQDEWPPLPIPPPPPSVPPVNGALRTQATPACAAVGEGADDCVTDVLFAVAAVPDLDWRADVVEPSISAHLIREADKARVAPPREKFIIAASTQPKPWSAVRAEVTLDKSIHDVAGAEDQSAFEKDFKRDVAQALGCTTSRVSIEKVSTPTKTNNCKVAFIVAADASGNSYDADKLAAVFAAPRTIASAKTITKAESIGMVNVNRAEPVYDVPEDDWSIWSWLLLLLLLLLLCCCGFWAAYFVGQSNGRNESVNKSEFLDLVMHGGDELHDKEQIAMARKQVSGGIDEHTRILFEQMDTDNSGTLSKEEIMSLVAAENLNVDPEYVDGVISAYDTDQSGDLDLEEFAAMHAVIQRKSAQAKLDARANSRLSMAVNYMEQKTGWDLDRDGDVGVAGRADTRTPRTAAVATNGGWRDQLSRLPRPQRKSVGASRQPAEFADEEYQAEEIKRTPPPLDSLRSTPQGDGAFGAVGLPTPQRSKTPERRPVPARPPPAAVQTDDRDPLGLGLGINQSGRTVRAAVPSSDRRSIEVGASVRGMAVAFNDGVATGKTLSEMKQSESLRGEKLKLELQAPPRRATTPPRLTSPSVGI